MKATPSPRLRVCAFTLIELLTVIAIIGILAAIIIPTVGVVRSNARATQCSSNMRQIGMACHLFAADNKGHFPYANGRNGSTKPFSWQLASYLGLENQVGSAPLPRAAGVLLCPSYKYDPNARQSPYAYNPNIDPNNGGVYGKEVWNYKATIGTASRLILLVESDGTDFYSPSADTGSATDAIYRRHPGNSANFCFADAHVERIKGKIPYNINGEDSGGDNRWLFYMNN
ncbi:prepilin-type N-terminal cleavage/methylation domain-containing protein [Opitutaceae bacterium TAV1]|nr:prepilin-type N-terminal cleavage/methylation domain-containing protein [Opitutaceae bacterium TAV1]